MPRASKHEGVVKAAVARALTEKRRTNFAVDNVMLAPELCSRLEPRRHAVRSTPRIPAPSWKLPFRSGACHAA